MAGDFPYRDAKPQGAADFYMAINATFRFVLDELGEEGLRAYWQDLGTRYQRPVWERWRAGGLPAVASYWGDFFEREPGAVVDVTLHDDRVALEVQVCPAIAHLRRHGREIVAEFCQHCAVMGDATAAQAGLAARVEGGDGSCRQVFLPLSEAGPQDWDAIRSCGREGDHARGI